MQDLKNILEILPERKDATPTNQGQIYDKAYERGWNACLDVIEERIKQSKEQG